MAYKDRRECRCLGAFVARQNLSRRARLGLSIPARLNWEHRQVRRDPFDLHGGSHVRRAVAVCNKGVLRLNIPTDLN